jgi:hypothetical protein
MEEWTCTRCQDAFFGIPPEGGLCISCQEETGETPVILRPRDEVKVGLFAGRDDELRLAEEQLRDPIHADYDPER